jgi:hypothetical protein
VEISRKLSRDDVLLAINALPQAKRRTFLLRLTECTFESKRRDTPENKFGAKALNVLLRVVGGDPICGRVCAQYTRLVPALMELLPPVSSEAQTTYGLEFSSVLLYMMRSFGMSSSVALRALS